jgi:hypothetical protein
MFKNIEQYQQRQKFEADIKAKEQKLKLKANEEMKNRVRN